MTVPRPRAIALFFALGAGACAGIACFRLLDPTELRTVSQWAASLNAGLFLLVLTLRLNMLSSLQSAGGLSIGEMRTNHALQATIARKTLQLMATMFLLAAAAGVPATSVAWLGSVWEWTVAMAGTATATGLVLVYLALHWRDDVSNAIAARKLAGESAARQTQLVKDMGAVPADVDATSDWAEQPPERVANGR